MECCDCNMQESVVPMAFLRAKPIGVMQMIDQGEQDDKARLGLPLTCIEALRKGFAIAEAALVCCRGACRVWQVCQAC